MLGFFRALSVKGMQKSEWRVWPLLAVTSVLCYAAFFAYCVFLADTSDALYHSEHRGAGEYDGRLVLDSCGPNWTVFGVRSACEGTITRLSVREGFDETVPYEVSFSRFTASDVGRSVPVYHTVTDPADEGWYPASADKASRVAEVVFGMLAIFGFFSALRLVFVVVVRGVFCLRAGKPAPSWRTRLVRIWFLAFMLAYSAYFTWGLYVVGDLEKSSPDGWLRVESCAPNWSMLGMRSRCAGEIDSLMRPEGEEVYYEEAFSRLSSSSDGKRVPMQEGISNQWMRTGTDHLPDFGGLLIFPLGFAALGACIRGVAITLESDGSRRAEPLPGDLK